MGKVSGSYESVVRGVSEQNPQSRESGQHSAQVNMISDPVRGLCRRHGSIMQDEQFLTVSGDGGGSPDLANALQLTQASRVVPIEIFGSRYDLIVRTETPFIEGPDYRDVLKGTVVRCFDKAARKFIPVHLGADTGILASLITYGASAVVNVGRYIYFGVRNYNTAATQFDYWGASDNQKLLVGWIRGGAYSRTFKVTLTKSDNTLVTASYTTPASSYQGVLDTSGVPATATDYQKQVNDIVNAYNGAVTAWIGTAAAAIVPSAIATQLRSALITAGVSSGVITADDGYLVINSTDYKEIKVEDSGDGSLVRGVGNLVDNLDLVSPQHYVGKIVKVEPPSRNGFPVYLQAYAKDNVSTGFAEVVWRETAGLQYTLNNVFCFATIEDDTLYLGGSASELQTLSGVANVPTFQTSVVGDADSSPLPQFIGDTIDYLGLFQDRLIIGSGSTLFFSRPGDYLNLFRQSVLTVQDDDPWEAYAIGGEDDTITHSVIYDRSLLLYGRNYQYVVNGRVAITPTSGNLQVVTAYEDAIDAPPVATGNFVFYATYSGTQGQEVASLHQTQPSNVQDVSNSSPVSQQLDTYLAGKPVEILAMTAPNLVLLRTTEDRSRVYTYTYLDNINTGERVLDSWSHWEWDADVGQLIGLSHDGADILMYMLKGNVDQAGHNSTWISCEKFVRDTIPSKLPYLDSQRPWGSVKLADVYPWSYVYPTMPRTDNVFIAFDDTVPERLLGTSLDNIDRLNAYGDRFTKVNPIGVHDLYFSAVVGYGYDAYVTPTNPFARDRNGKAILSGRLTLVKVRVSVTDTAGLTCTVETRGLTKTALNFTGRILGQSDDLVGRQPIVTTDLSAFIGGEVRECTYTLSANLWMPMTINSIEWTGQFFFNTRRA